MLAQGTLIGDGLPLFGEALSIISPPREVEYPSLPPRKYRGNFSVDSTSVFEVTRHPEKQTASGRHIFSQLDEESAQTCRIYGREVVIHIFNKEEFSNTRIDALLSRVSNAEEARTSVPKE